MADVYSTEKRSDIMSRIRSTGTRPESRLSEIVADVFAEYEILRNPSDVTGTPDIYVPSLDITFFLDGCFFHSCPRHGHIPKTNKKYWREKIARNVRRDHRLTRQLREAGISVWRFWEHDVKTEKSIRRTRKRVELALQRCEEWL